MAQVSDLKNVKVSSILHDRHFNMGFKEYLTGNGFNPDYNKWDGRSQWRYERGRLFAAATGGTVPVKEQTGRRNPPVSSHAIRTYIKLNNDKSII